MKLSNTAKTLMLTCLVTMSQNCSTKERPQKFATEPAYVASQLVKAMLKRRIHVDGARARVLSLTFKVHLLDLNNNRVLDVVEKLRDYGCLADVQDPCANAEEARAEYGLDLIDMPEAGAYEGTGLELALERYEQGRLSHVREYGNQGQVVFDFNNVFFSNQSDLRL